ncbi:MAG TPA: ribulose-phosphate 3-epimerase [bacterium]|nr:ribulose-phosphate 3-epimerase [bacterium]
MSGAAGRIKIAASILAADFGRLAEAARDAAEGGAAQIHVDVMDGRFVPEITMGPAVVRAVQRAAAVPADVHLMIVEPERHLDAFAQAGAAAITVHVEACPHLYDTVRRIAALGVRPGVALNPATPPEQAAWVLPHVAHVLVMTVEPGAGGQPFIPEMTAKVATLAAWRRERSLDFEIAVDGGISPETAGRVVEAGATVLVAGTAVFGAADGVAAAIARLRTAALRPVPAPDRRA